MKVSIRNNSKSTFLIAASKIEGGTLDDFDVFQPDIGESMTDAIEALRSEGYVIFEVYGYSLTIDDILAKHEEEVF